MKGYTLSCFHAGLAVSEIWPFRAADFLSKMSASAIFNFFKFIPIYTWIIYSFPLNYGIAAELANTTRGHFERALFWDLSWEMRVSTSFNIYILIFQCVTRSELSEWKENGDCKVYDSFFKILKRWIPPNGTASLDCECLMWISCLQAL